MELQGKALTNKYILQDKESFVKEIFVHCDLLDKYRENVNFFCPPLHFSVTMLQ